MKGKPYKNLLGYLTLTSIFVAVDAPDTPPDPFLGLLSIAEGVSIYGFLLNTKIKILVAIRDSDLMKEGDIKLVGINSIFC